MYEMPICKQLDCPLYRSASEQCVLNSDTIAMFLLTRLKDLRPSVQVMPQDLQQDGCGIVITESTENGQTYNVVYQVGDANNGGCVENVRQIANIPQDMKPPIPNISKPAFRVDPTSQGLFSSNIRPEKSTSKFKPKSRLL